MRRGAVLILLAGCSGLPDVPRPAPDRAQVLVHVIARKRPGVADPSRRDSYDRGPLAPGSGRGYERVDYAGMQDIAVFLEGTGLPAGGPAPATQHLRAGARFDRDLILLAPGGRTRLAISNERGEVLTVYCRGQRDGFEAVMAAGATQDVTLREPGLYEVLCDEDDSLRMTLLVAPTSWAATAASGGWAVFDGLPPGSYEVSAVAPRLPRWTGCVTVAAGGRGIVEASLSVGNLGGPGR